MQASRTGGPATQPNLLSKLFIVKQSVQGHDRRRAPRGRRAPPFAGLLAGLLLAGAASATDAPPPPPGAGANLRLSPQLSAPGQPADDAERALLRVEWKAAQSRSEAERAVADTMERVRRLEEATAQVRAALEQAPAAPPPPAQAPAPAAAPATPTAPAAPAPASRAAEPPGPTAPVPAGREDGPDIPWEMAAGGLALLAGLAGLAGLRVLRRRRKDAEPPPEATAMALTILAEPPPEALRRKRPRRG